MVAAAGAPHGPRAQLYLSFPREFVETKQRGVNTINISSLAYSAAEGWRSCRLSAERAQTAPRGCRGLNTFMALPLTPLLLLAAEWKVLGRFTGAEGLLGPETGFFYAKCLKDPRYPDVSWILTGASLSSCFVVGKIIFSDSLF